MFPLALFIVILLVILLSICWHKFLICIFLFLLFVCVCLRTMCMWYIHSFFMCIGAHMNGCTCTCMPVRVVAQSWSWESSSMLFHLIYWAGVSQSNPEFMHRSSLASQLAVGIPYSFLLRQESQAGHHTHLAFMWVLRFQLLVLPFAWQTH